jgi:molecular chaperone DnaJ
VLRGLGVPGLRGGRGDLVVTVQVETPTRLDAHQEQLLRELAAVRGEERPTGHVKPAQKSVFGRLRDAFGTAH